MYLKDTRMGTEHVITSNSNSVKLLENISPSTQYGIFVQAKNSEGLGPANDKILYAVTLTRE